MDDLETFSKDVLAAAVKTIKQCSALPSAGDDYEYYSNYLGYQTFCNRVGGRINKLIGKVLLYEEVPVSWPAIDRTSSADPELVEEQFDALVEANDVLLERVSSLLDKATGVKDPELAVTAASPAVPVASWNRSDMGGVVPQWRSNIPRPQNQFKDMIDNSESLFIPLLRTKPNALRPLPAIYSELKNPSTLQALIENAKKWAESPDRLNHPYQYEIEQFEPLEEQLVISEPQVAKTLEETSLTMVTTPEQLNGLLTDLKAATEIAIDLEAHSYRSFQGFVCLMQLSTRAQDYIVDTLALREHLFCLNDVFTDPKIIKVMHGADWDIVWLQRDFGLYIVNMFDTGQASRVLALPRYSLAFLLQYCCGITADKRYQLADWRMRPLPSDMIKYAREDTHYLLYIYDRMRNELIRRSNAQANLILTVIENSRTICLKQYTKPLLHEDDHFKLCKKFKRSLSPQQLYGLKLLYEWRYNLARREDESCGYVLPNHMLFQLAEILPREVEGILACCNPVPTLLRQQLQEVHRLIQTARESPGTPARRMIPEVITGGSLTELKTVEMEAEESIDYGSDDDKVITISGPPVSTKLPSIDFKVLDKPLTQDAKDKYSRLQEMLSNCLAQFMKPAAFTAVSIAPPTVIKKRRREEATPTTPVESKKRKLIPEVTDETTPTEETPETEPTVLPAAKAPKKSKFKKPSLEEETPLDFKAFDYSSTTFSSAVQQEPVAVKSSKPTVKSQEKKAPRSRVTRRISQKSGTFKTKK